MPKFQYIGLLKKKKKHNDKISLSSKDWQQVYKKQEILYLLLYVGLNSKHPMKMLQAFAFQ